MDDYRDTESCLGSTRGTNWFPLRSFLPHRGSEQTRVEWLFDDVRPGSPCRVVRASRREGQSDLLDRGASHQVGTSISEAESLRSLMGSLHRNLRETGFS